MRSWLSSFFVLLVVVLLASLPMLGLREMTSDDEAQRAQPPVEMLQTGDWLVPRLNGKPYIKKPPLIYWQTVPVYAALGINEWTARISSVAAGVVVMAIMLARSRRLVGDRGAFFATLFLMTNFLVIGKLRQCQLEIHMLLWTMLAQWAWCSALVRLDEDRPGARRFIVVGGLALAVANMYKFPVPWLFTVGPVLAVVAWRRRWSWLARPEWIIALVVSALPFAVWSWAVAESLGWDRVHRIYQQEVALRIQPTRLQTEPIHYYVGVLLGGFGPWCLVALGLLRRGVRDHLARVGLPMVFAIGGGAVCLAFLTITPAKEAEYLIPALPLFALVLGVVIEGLLVEAHDERIFERNMLVGACAATVLIVAGWLTVDYLKTLNEHAKRSPRATAEHIRALDEQGVPVYYFNLDRPSLYFYTGKTHPATDSVNILKDELWSRQHAVIVAEAKRHDRLVENLPGLVEFYTAPASTATNYEFHVYEGDAQVAAQSDQ